MEHRFSCPLRCGTNNMNNFTKTYKEKNERAKYFEIVTLFNQCVEKHKERMSLLEERENLKRFCLETLHGEHHDCKKEKCESCKDAKSVLSDMLELDGVMNAIK